jgi:pyridoxal 5'-phosphate synthase pdxT subunit
MKIGVLALQGDFREHIDTLRGLNVESHEVKTLDEIQVVDALVIPGGESTTISKLAIAFGLMDPIRLRIAQGMPVYGSCAGMILLAKEIVDPASEQESFGGIDIKVRRNAFGRQVDSFESDLTVLGIHGDPVKAIFIRAPWVESAGPEVQVLAAVEVEGRSHPVAVRQANALATSFHPEISGDNRIHRYFLEEICQPAVGK